MANLAVTAILGIVVALFVSTAVSWRKRYAAAKSTGFPVFLSPVFLTDVWWQLSYLFLVPLLNRLPRSWTFPWLEMNQRWSLWKIAYKPYLEIGSDTFIISTSRGNMLWTCDAKVINQLETMHPKSQVAVDLMKFFDLYGPTLGTVEGPDGGEWKRHRKVIMQGFEPSTNAMVWKETRRQTAALLQQWSKDGSTVQVMKYFASRLGLHVISAVFFRKHLVWGDNPEGELMSGGHRLTFDKAIFQVIAELHTLVIIPRALLGMIPMQQVRNAHLAFTEWTRYLKELSADSLARLGEISAKKDRSIVESIVLAAKTGENPLPEESILGNLFFMMMAGHETTGNTMGLALNILAVYPEYQSKIQEELDRALAGRPYEEWTVGREYQALQKGWIGAVLKEVLRVYCVVVWFPRKIIAPINVVDSNGTSHTIPGDTLCGMHLAASFRNPSNWPQLDVPTDRREELHNSPAAVEFNPAQWLADGESTAIGAESVAEGTAPRHMPFGQGPHVCPGRHFAQVEMVAALATILVRHNLELVVSEETLASCGGNETAARAKTRDNAFRMLIDDIDANIGIQLLKPLLSALSSEPEEGTQIESTKAVSKI